MDQDLITDITLNHLPDLSDTSISFQIPSDNTSADLLLADHTNTFEVLCDAVDDDASFAPIPLEPPRGPPLSLGELTPRVQVAPPTPRPPRPPSPTQVPSSSAKPSVIQQPLTLGHRSPDKPRKTPSRVTSIKRRYRENPPLVAEERLQPLCEEAGTLGQEENESSAHVRIHAIDSAKLVSLERRSSPHANSQVIGKTHDTSPQSEDVVVLLPEKTDVQDVHLSAVEDVVMATGDSCQAVTADVAVRAPMPKSRRIPRKSKPTVAAGGIPKHIALPLTHVSKKTKGKPPRVQEEHPVPPSAACQPTPPSITSEEELAPPAWNLGGLGLNPEKTQITHTGTGGLAERLVSYSQKLISSIGLSKLSLENSSLAPEDDVRVADIPIETQPAAARPPSPSPQCINDIPNTHSEPLRLSEISPRKLPPEPPQSSSNVNTGGLQDGSRRAMSPMRPAKKRASMDVDQISVYPRRKRGKAMTADAECKRGSSNEEFSQDQPPVKKPARLRKDQHVTHPETGASSLPSPRTKYRPKLATAPAHCKGPTLNAFPYLSGSRQVQRINRAQGRRYGGQYNAARDRAVSSLSRSSASSQGKRIRQENTTESRHTHPRSGPTWTVDLPLIEKKQNAATFVAELTKPVGFTFRVDARLEARKTEERLAASEPGKTQPHVHDARAHHRASQQAASVIQKREGVVPSVPVVPFFFCTEQRAKEREKFDEMVKRKEEEMETLKEVRRRREVEEEEMAIKELRRKAIPKANEVPEWYADMPKRKGTVV